MKKNNKKLGLTRGIRLGWVCTDSIQSNLVPTSVSVGHSDSRLAATASYHHRYAQGYGDKIDTYKLK